MSKIEISQSAVSQVISMYQRKEEWAREIKVNHLKYNKDICFLFFVFFDMFAQ